MSESRPNFAELVRKARLELEPQLQLAELIAEVRWHSYQSHLKVGFTEAQALELCKYTLIK